MKPDYQREGITLYCADCLDVLPHLSGVDAVVTDPPYGLSFMGKHWDYDVPSQEIWEACFAALKPGAHLLAFAGTRTQHRMAVRIEDAGFEIRDMIAWVYGSGFPKSMNLSKAIDKAAGAFVKGDVLPSSRESGASASGIATTFRQKTAANPQSDSARAWQGWGTALKPALEPITVARKPLVGTVAQNVERFGTGAINVDGCRVSCADVRSGGFGAGKRPWQTGGNSVTQYVDASLGRWPANLIHDGSAEVLALFPECEDGNLSRFFYCAKASKADRDEGCEGMEEKQLRTTYDKSVRDKNGNDSGYARHNPHPTVKPTDLMRYLCRLITPPNGIILDPFMGSGSTGKAAIKENFRFIGIEKDRASFDIAVARVEAELNQGDLFRQAK